MSYVYELLHTLIVVSLEEWYFSREKLTYLRELGEGEFGKVLLMTAKVSVLLFILQINVPLHGFIIYKRVSI